MTTVSGGVARHTDLKTSVDRESWPRRNKVLLVIVLTMILEREAVRMIAKARRSLEEGLRS